MGVRPRKSMNSEVENLISNLLIGGRIEIKDGKLLVSPRSTAEFFRKEITRLKPEILIYLSHCPICASGLVVKIENLREKTRRHSYCPTAGHYDKWEI